MHLNNISNPQDRGIDLTPRGNRIEMENGWNVEGFYDDLGNEYERATKGAGTQRVVRWFVLAEDKD